MLSSHCHTAHPQRPAQIQTCAITRLGANLDLRYPMAGCAQAATKELKRLRGMGEQQPGFAAARAYLDTLAELPWQRTSADVQREAAGAPAGLVQECFGSAREGTTPVMIKH